MQISIAAGDALRYETPLLALFVWEGEALGGPLAGLIEEGDWSGGFKKTLLLYPRGAVAARRLVLVGLGTRDAITADRLREAGAVATQRAAELKVQRYAAALPALDGALATPGLQALVEGSLLGAYRFDRYKSKRAEDEGRGVAELTLLAAREDDTVARAVRQGEAVAGGVQLARDLANAPGNEVTPTRLAEVAQNLGERYGMQVTVLGLDELRAQGFGGIVGVGQGSDQPPRFIAIQHGQPGEGVPTICLVGKGITFDTGGISIKPSEKMEDMKMDMGGAAAVLGAMQVVGELKLPLHVVALISAAENMPSGTAYKPGDILSTLSGKTIEVINTDAEGRIVLADALFYAQRFQPQAIIDLATLTGGVSVALGPHAIGLVSNSDEVSQRVLAAAEESGERAWRLPLWDAYLDMVKSDIADVKNSAGRAASTITGGAFLANFVGDYPWVHLDIASTAWVERPHKAYTVKGATGVGVRLVVQLLQNWAGRTV
ncbi:MAG TPA: leucyl aminopeptidase [Roseiflexaceae bacterium]|nr:leucyl aminopeptidase [Roseiflexaceae bacterium]